MSNKGEDILGVSGGKRTVNVGYGNFVLVDRLVVILESGSLPVRRLRERACESGMLLDATAGRKMRSVIVTDTGHVILSALASSTVQERVQGSRSLMSLASLELEDGEFVS